VACFVACFGCGDGRIATYPVTGAVTVDGQPAEGVLIVFCPTEGPEEFQSERPFGNTGSGGKFELTTFNPQDGAPAGQYKVMAQWRTKPQQASPEQDPDRQPAAMDRLGYKYINPETSGLTATVDEGPTELPPFELKTN
jgi:hypothetical protein